MGFNMRRRGSQVPEPGGFNRPARPAALLLMALLGGVLIVPLPMLGYAITGGSLGRIRLEQVVMLGVVYVLHVLITWFTACLALQRRPLLISAALVYGGSLVGMAILVLVGCGLGVLAGMILLPAAACFAVSSLKPVGNKDHPYRCKGCGYPLYGNTTGHCPECGRAVTRAQRERLSLQRDDEVVVNAEALGSASTGPGET